MTKVKESIRTHRPPRRRKRPKANGSATCVMKTAQYMTRQRGVTRIDELAFHSGLSVRQYERRFAEEAGVTRSCLRGVTRFGMALEKKRLAPDRSWARVAHEFHLTDSKQGLWAM